jgi:hypothetical protein
MLEADVFGGVVGEEAAGGFEDADGSGGVGRTIFYPMPGVQDLVGVEVAGFGLEAAGGEDGHLGYLLPVDVANDGHAGDEVGVLAEDVHLLPARGPGGAFHVGQVGEQADGLAVLRGDDNVDFLCEVCDVFGGERAGDFEAVSGSVTLGERFDHLRASLLWVGCRVGGGPKEK